MLQTVYAELLDRSRIAAFSQDFPNDGVFIPKVVRNRRYWYFQASAANGPRPRNMSVRKPPISLHASPRIGAFRTWQRDQRSLVATLTRGGNFPTPRRDVGELAAALAEAGVFRLRGVLVGTVAYQTYSAMLGVRLAAALVRTDDLDVAQYRGGFRRPLALPPGRYRRCCARVDPSFRPVPHLDPARAVRYAASSGLKVDFLTPNRGKDSEEPRYLPAFGTDAQQLRFLDFLIRDPESAVLLHGTGVLVTVPAPQRYALHKLIVARRRHEEGGKREKDLLQAGALLDTLVDRRPHELRAAWLEAFHRGKTWQRLIGEGLGLLHPATRDRVLLTGLAPLAVVVPGIDIRFVPERAVYDRDIDAMRFYGVGSGPFAFAGREGIACTITRDALSALAGVTSLAADESDTIFSQYRTCIEQLTRDKYLMKTIDIVGEVAVTVADLE